RRCDQVLFRTERDCGYHGSAESEKVWKRWNRTISQVVVMHSTLSRIYIGPLMMMQSVTFNKKGALEDVYTSYPFTRNPNKTVHRKPLCIEFPPAMAEQVQGTVKRNSGGLNYFAYGSNMWREQMDMRDAPFRHRIPAALHGYKLVFNKAGSGAYSFANVEKVSENEESIVYGILYTGCSYDTVKSLDVYEGVKRGHYAREKLDVVVPFAEDVDITDALATIVPGSWCVRGLEDPETPTRQVEAVVYIAGQDWIDDDLEPTKEYVEKLLMGKDLLPASYVKFIEQYLPGQSRVLTTVKKRK
ncbi:hypothetical protein BC937DRAFT_90118, partial [Endogone sp. FLAS-F59071]